MTPTARARTFALLALAILCAGSAGIGITLWSFGSGLTPDGVTYVDMAQSIAHGKGLTHRWAYWDPVYETGTLPTATTLWPPGYSLAIAALVIFGFDPYVAGRLICLLSFAALPFPIYGLARFLLPPAHALLSTGVVMALSPMVHFPFFVATESPFLLLSTLSLLYTIHGLQAQTTREATYSWLTASAAAGAAFLMRYVGVACVAGVVVAALLPGTKKSLRTRALHLAVAAGPAGLVVTAVLLRNWFISGALVYASPYASPNADEFWAMLGHTVRATIGSIIGSKELLGPSFSLLRPLELALLGGLTGLALVSFWQAHTTARNHHRPLRGALASGVICLFIVLGLAVAVWGSAAAGVEARYVTIYLPWCFVLLLGWALRVANHDPRAPWAATANRCARFGCLLWVSCQIAVTALTFSAMEEGHVGAGTRSATIAWVRMNVAPNETLLTNQGAGLAYWCPNPILRLPWPPFSARGLASWDAIDRLATKARARYLVHFFGYPKAPKRDPEGFRFLRSLDAPESFPERHPISFSDGVVYEVGVSGVSNKDDPPR